MSASYTSNAGGSASFDYIRLGSDEQLKGIAIPNAEGKITRVAIEQIQQSSDKENNESSLEGTSLVQLNAKNSKGDDVKIWVKASKIAEALNVADSKIISYQKSGKLEEKIVLRQHGLTKKEFKQIQAHVEKNREALKGKSKPVEGKREPVHIRGSKNHLPRSIVYVPGEGAYILLKDKGNVKEIGLGAFNRVTKAVHLETGKVKVFRTAKMDAVPENEINANEMLQSRPDLFVIGTALSYRGPWRTRRRSEGRRLNESKNHLPCEEVDKVGIIMDLIDGGELFARIFPNDEETVELSYDEIFPLACSFVEALAYLHDRELAHLDLKPENIMVTSDGQAKISDFGFTDKAGTKVDPRGSPGYLSPEIIKASSTLGELYQISPKADIWALGCILAVMLRGWSWFKAIGQAWIDSAGQRWINPEFTLNANYLNRQKSRIFKHKDDPNHLDNLICQCLESDPKKRPTAQDVLEKLRELRNMTQRISVLKGAEVGFLDLETVSGTPKISSAIMEVDRQGQDIVIVNSGAKYQVLFKTETGYRMLPLDITSDSETIGIGDARVSPEDFVAKIQEIGERIPAIDELPILTQQHSRQLSRKHGVILRKSQDGKSLVVSVANKRQEYKLEAHGDGKFGLPPKTIEEIWNKVKNKKATSQR